MRPHEGVGRHREDVGTPLFGAAEAFQLGRALLQLLDRALERRDRRLGFVAAGAHRGDEAAGAARGLGEGVDRLEQAPQERHDEKDEDEGGRGHRDREDAGVAARLGDRRAVPHDPQDSCPAGQNDGDRGGSAVPRADERLDGRPLGGRRHRHGSESRVRQERGVGYAPALHVVERGAARVHVAEEARDEVIRHERLRGIGCHTEAVRDPARLGRQAPQVLAHAPRYGVPKDDDGGPGEEEQRREAAHDHVADLALERAARHGRSLGIHGTPAARYSHRERPKTNAASAPHARNTPNGTSARARRTSSPAGVASARAARTRKKSAPSSSARRPFAVRAPRWARARASRTNARRRPAARGSAVKRVPSAAAPGISRNRSEAESTRPSSPTRSPARAATARAAEDERRARRASTDQRSARASAAPPATAVPAREAKKSVKKTPTGPVNAPAIASIFTSPPPIPSWPRSLA